MELTAQLEGEENAVVIETKFSEGQYWKTYGGRALVKILSSAVEMTIKAELMQGTFRQIIYFQNVFYTKGTKPQKFEPENPQNHIPIKKADSFTEYHPWAVTELETDSKKILKAHLYMDQK